MIPDTVRKFFPFLDDGAPARDAPDDEDIGYPDEDDYPDEDEDRAKVARHNV